MKISIQKNNELLDAIICLLETEKHPDEYDNIQPEIYIRNLEMYTYILSILNKDEIPGE